MSTRKPLFVAEMSAHLLSAQQRLPTWVEQHQSDEATCEALAEQLAQLRALLAAERAASKASEMLLFDHELHMNDADKARLGSCASGLKRNFGIIFFYFFRHKTTFSAASWLVARHYCSQQS